MKGYIKPDKIEKGVCMICKEPCELTAYVHLGCALVYSDEKERRIDEARNKPIK